MRVSCVQACALVCVLAGTLPAADDWLWDFNSPPLPPNMILASGTLGGTESPSFSYSLEGGSLRLVDPETAANGGAIWAVGAHSKILGDVVIQGQMQSATNNIGLGTRSLGPDSGYILGLLHPEGDPTRALAALYKAGTTQPILAATEPVLSDFDQPFFLELSTVGQNPVQLTGRVFRDAGGPELLTVSAVDDGSDGVGPFAVGNAGFVVDTVGLPLDTGHIDATFDNISAVTSDINTVVVPAGLEQKDGITLFGQGAHSPTGFRMQEVYPASDFSPSAEGPAVLLSMAFRPDRTANGSRTIFLPDLQIHLSTTNAAPGSLSQTFANNIGDDDAIVYSGDVTLTTDGIGLTNDLNDFDYVVNFQQPFVYDPSQGNLLVDWSIGGGATGPPPLFDGHNSGPIQLQMARSPTATWATTQFSGVTVKRFEYVVLPTGGADPGDFNLDGKLSVEDIDLLTAAVISDPDQLEFDINEDDRVDQQDREMWVKKLKHTWWGDADLNGEFNSSDFVQVFQAGKYETTQDASWSEGDWNGDGVFDSGDFVIAFQDGGYEMGPRTDAPAVPEPMSALLLMTGLIGVAVCRRRLEP